MGNGKDFVPLMQQVATLLLGKPNKAMSSKRELRFGSNGSIAVDLSSGTAYDFASEKGGGVLWLIELQTGKKGKAAFDWLREHGLELPQEDQDDDGPAGRSGVARKPQRAAGSVPARPRLDRAMAVGDHEGGAQAPAGDGPWAFLKLPRDATLAATYDYTDENGGLIFQVCRFEFEEDGKREKSFRQRRPDAARRDGWSWQVKDQVRLVPYRLPELLEDLAQDRVVYVAEGEKDVDNLRALGVPATCNAGGAGKWPDALVPFFSGADVVILPDNDPQKVRKADGALMVHDDGTPMLAGQDHAKLVATALSVVARRVRVLELARHTALPVKGDVSDWVEQGGSADMLLGLLPAAIDGALYDPAEWFLAQSYAPHFRMEAWPDLFQPGPTHEWLVKNVLTRGEVAMLAGASQAGKSFLTIDLAMAICLGKPFLSHKVVHPGAVIYQAGEGYAGLRSLRIPAYAKAHGLGPDAAVPFALLGAPVNLWASDDDTDKLIADIKAKMRSLTVPLQLIVIDTLAAAIAGANENASEDVGRALARANRLREATGASVLLVHHMNASGEKYRGWTGLGANVDSVLIARELEGMHDQQGRKVREVEVQKLKDGSKPKPIRFVLKGITVDYDEDGQEVTSCVVEQPDAGFAEPVPPRASPKGLKMSPQAKIMLECVERAILKSPVPPPDGGEFGPGMGGTLDPYVRKLFASKMGSGGKQEPQAVAARLRKAWERQTEFLQANGLIEIQDDYVWRTRKGLRGSLWDPDRDTGPDLVPQVAALDDDVDVGF